MDRSAASLIEHLSSIQDPRMLAKTDHDLVDIIVITVCATICHCDDSWESIEEFGQERKTWLKQFLPLKNGIPSHDTFRRIFLLLNPEDLQKCFMEWTKDLQTITAGEVVAIDGKTPRGSFDNQLGNRAIHSVSAWATENQLVLGQIKVDTKSNEITAIPKLLDLLEVKGCVITIDAMGTQTEIAAKIIEKKADYLLALKGNQGDLHQAVEYYFNDALKNNFRGIRHTQYETVDGDHGRIETRRYYKVKDINWLDKKNDWAGLSGIGMVLSEVEKNGAMTQEKRYFITSLKGDAEEMGKASRKHWGIENTLHWSLDVSLREDECRRRKGHLPMNSAIIRRMVINLLKKESSNKRKSINGRRLKACLNENYLLKVLLG
ncbi:MAG: ISAs1 family transposase [Pseudomonadota bacterium]